ncbi:hypothetical protein EF834_04895 [Rhodococcus spongiicola]|uniref:UDP-N-acetylglucosamine kinase n=1 Tax=Rhodococcus spongiicola TaxID=2487352 RepID=A0A438B0E5_9NOCA|nr:hypothetical protein EF834_04895 [Rhodococcus spongiicola]
MTTPEEIESRQELLAALSEPGGPLQADSPHATIRNPRYYQKDQKVGGAAVPLPERRALHLEIRAAWRAEYPNVRTEQSSVLLAGPPGAGKSSIIRNSIFADRDPSHWRLLDADVFKDALLSAEVEAGTWQEMLPPEYRTVPPEKPLFHPNELSALVRHESTDLFEQVFYEAIDNGDNLILDGTLAWKEWAVDLVSGLNESGYRIQIVDVEAPQDVAVERIVSRWRKGYLEAMATSGQDIPMGGRWIPRSAVDRLFTETRESDNLPLCGSHRPRDRCPGTSSGGSAACVRGRSCRGSDSARVHAVA